MGAVGDEARREAWSVEARRVVAVLRWGEDAVIPAEVLLRGGDKRAELFDELQRFKDDMGGAVGPRSLELV